MSNENKDFLQDQVQTSEDLLGPPQIDVIGVVMMVLISIIVGMFISISVLVASFFSAGKFSFESGVSPIILAFTTFFALSIGGAIYIGLAKNIFPAIYTRNAFVLKQFVVYMIVLYLCMMPIYIGASASSFETESVLFAYLVHILLAIFGIELLLGAISQYRYILLSFYANVSALILAGGIIFWIFQHFSKSGTSIFILMGLSVLMFFLSTSIIFLIKFLYYIFYKLTGNDPLGTLFYSIEMEEKQEISKAQNNLLQ